MARYTFTCQHFNYNDFNGDEQDVASMHTTQFRADDLNTMLENFELFLRGSGFVFDGVIDVVKPEDEKYEANSKVIEHMVADLLRQQEIQELQGNCEVCGIAKGIMAVHKCFDKNCPLNLSNSI